MKNLGKIFLALVLVPNAIYASVVASMDYASVSVGDTVTYSIKVDGNDLQRPLLDRLCDTGIIATSAQTNIEMINGDYKKTKILSYQFMPQKSCVIKPLDIVVDGKTQTTNAVKVDVKPATQEVNGDFIVELSGKKDVYVGEPFEMSVLIKQKHSAQALDSKFVVPDMQGFWKSGEPKQDKYDEGAFTITKLTYRLSAQREGELKISPAQLAIATRANVRNAWGSFGQDVKWKSYFSNELSVNAKPIPNGAKFIGDFVIKATVDKREINPNEAVNVTLEISGEGNLEDVVKFKPYVNDVSVFDEKPVVTGNKFTQKLALVGDNDFTIPEFTLTFFNSKTKTLETISTKAIDVKVNGAKPTRELIVKRDEAAVATNEKSVTVVEQTNVSTLWTTLAFLLGLAIGVILALSKPWERLKKEKPFDVKDEKKLLMKLIPFKDEENVQEILDVLEANVYSNAKKTIDKKLLQEILKRCGLV
mgnify:CR=1 FL=1